MTSSVTPDGQLSAEGFEAAEQLLADAAAGKFRAGAFCGAPQQEPEPPPMPSKELAKLVVEAHQKHRAAVAHGNMDQAKTHLAERRRLEQSFKAAQEIEKEAEEARRSYLASSAYANRCAAEKAEIAQAKASADERESWIEAKSAALCRLYVGLNDASFELAIRESQSSAGSHSPPKFADEALQQSVLRRAAERFMATLAPGRRSSAAHFARMIVTHQRALQGAQLADEPDHEANGRPLYVPEPEPEKKKPEQKEIDQ